MLIPHHFHIKVLQNSSIPANFIDSYFPHFEQLHFSCIRCSFEQNTKKLMIYLRSLSDMNNFLFLFIFGDIVWVPITFECYHFWSEYNYLNKYLVIIAPLWNKVSTAIKYFISSPDNCPCSRSNGEATPNLKNVVRNVLFGCCLKW